jgi:hypothetical protein
MRGNGGRLDRCGPARGRCACLRRMAITTAISHDAGASPRPRRRSRPCAMIRRRALRRALHRWRGCSTADGPRTATPVVPTGGAVVHALAGAPRRAQPARRVAARQRVLRAVNERLLPHAMVVRSRGAYRRYWAACEARSRCADRARGARGGETFSFKVPSPGDSFPWASSPLAGQGSLLVGAEGSFRRAGARALEPAAAEAGRPGALIPNAIKPETREPGAESSGARRAERHPAEQIRPAALLAGSAASVSTYACDCPSSPSCSSQSSMSK